ncbi:MAG: hypothetical protein ABJG47_14720 [Ekhidna sp.]
MHRNLYITGIIVFTIVGLFGCFWLFNSLIHGTEFTEFVAFPNLTIIDGINVLILEIVFLVYLHLKKYKVAFAFSLLSAITFLILYSTVYLFYQGVGAGDSINLIVTIHLVAVTLFSLSLIFSKSSERPLLKTAGYLGAVVGLIILPTHVVGVYMPEGATLDILIYIGMLVGRLGGLIVIFYILNFYQELRSEVNAALQT